MGFGTAGFEVLAVIDDNMELPVDVETTPAAGGRSACGRRAEAKDRRWVTLRDVPAGRRFVRLRWRKRIWLCVDPDCEVNMVDRAVHHDWYAANSGGQKILDPDDGDV